jgi:hypothetical protein
MSLPAVEEAEASETRHHAVFVSDATRWPAKVRLRRRRLADVEHVLPDIGKNLTGLRRESPGTTPSVSVRACPELVEGATRHRFAGGSMQ